MARSIFDEHISRAGAIGKTSTIEDFDVDDSLDDIAEYIEDNLEDHHEVKTDIRTWGSRLLVSLISTVSGDSRAVKLLHEAGAGFRWSVLFRGTDATALRLPGSMGHTDVEKNLVQQEVEVASVDTVDVATPPSGAEMSDGINGSEQWAPEKSSMTCGDDGPADGVLREDSLDLVPLSAPDGEPRPVEADLEDQKFIEVQGHLVYVTAEGYQVVSEKEDDIDLFSNYTGTIERDVLTTDGIQEERHFEGIIRYDGQEFPFRVAARDYKSGKFQECLRAQVGPGPDTWKASLLLSAMRKQSTPVSVRVIKKFGWDDQRRFLTPSGQICPPGVEPVQDLSVDLSGCGKASNLDLISLPQEEVVDVTKIIFDDLLQTGDSRSMHLALAFALSPVVGEYIGHPSSLGMHLWGTSGTLKTVCARALQCFFGPGFAKPESILSWTSTSYSLQQQGYYYSSAIALVDDFKHSVVQSDSHLQVLIQNLFDREGRGRLTGGGAKLAKGYPFRGYLLSTGEDPMDQSASNTARVLPLPWDAEAARRTPRDRVGRIVENQPRFSAFTRVFVSHLQKKEVVELRERQERTAADLGEMMEGQSNGPRIANQLALLYLAFCEFLSCAAEIGVDTVEVFRRQDTFAEILHSYVGNLLERLDETEPGKLFLRYLRSVLDARPDLIASEPSTRHHLGFFKDTGSGRLVCVLPDQACSAARALCRQSGKRFPFSQDAVAADLKAKGLLICGSRGRLKTQVRWNNARPYVWQFPSEILGITPPAAARTGSLRCLLEGLPHPVSIPVVDDEASGRF